MGVGEFRHTIVPNSVELIAALCWSPDDADGTEYQMPSHIRAAQPERCERRAEPLAVPADLQKSLSQADMVISTA